MIFCCALLRDFCLPSATFQWRMWCIDYHISLSFASRRALLARRYRDDAFLACGAFPLGRGENKITGIILTLMNVQICLHRYTLSRSFHPFPPLWDLLLMTHNTQHTNPCCFPRSFHVRLSSFLSRILTSCAPQTGMQRLLACGATLVAC